VAIERKTIQDFIVSMINKRLVRQLEEIKQYRKQILVIESTEKHDTYCNDKKINSNAIRGFILSILLDMNIPILFTKDSQDTAMFLWLLARKKEKSNISLRVKRKVLNKRELLQFILEGFPGIGPATAKKLLQRFKTIKNIFNTPIEILKKEIGKKAYIFKIIEDCY